MQVMELEKERPAVVLQRIIDIELADKLLAGILQQFPLPFAISDQRIVDKHALYGERMTVQETRAALRKQLPSFHFSDEAIDKFLVKGAMGNEKFAAESSGLCAYSRITI